MVAPLMFPNDLPNEAVHTADAARELFRGIAARFLQ
jgi:hypothetical protein